MRILLANEFGAGHGHVASLAKLAEAIAARSAKSEILYCVPRANAAVRVGIDSKLLVPQDLSPFDAEPGVPAGNVLRGIGPFLAGKMVADADAFLQRIGFWRSLLAKSRFDIVVAEYAPTLLMSARGKVPVLALGNGYTLPPPEAKAFYGPISGRQSDSGAEQTITDKLNKLLVLSGSRRISVLPRIFRADAYALMTIPLFDPHWEVREQDYLGLDQSGGAPSPVEQYDGILAYFSYPNTVKKAAKLLRSIDLPVEAYFAGATAAELDVEDCPHISVRDRLFKFSEAMPGKALIVHGGTLGTAAAAMYAGVPQVGLYLYDEQQANAYATRRAGIGKAMSIMNAKTETFAAAVKEAAASQEMRNYARQLSSRYRDLANNDPYALAAERVLGLARI